MSKKHKQKLHKKVKEYIYLDNEEVNSVLAQFEDGIPQVIEQIQQSTESTSDEAGGEFKSGAEGGINIAAHANAKVGASFSSKNTQGNSEMVQEAVSTVYDDYAVDIMVKELDENGLLKFATKQEEGAFVKLTSYFDMINPASMGQNMSMKAVKAMINFSTDNDDGEEKNAVEGFKMFKRFGNILSSFYPDSILLKTNNALTIAKANLFRMNQAQLTSLLLSNRKITIIGKVESKISINDLDADVLSDTASNDFASAINIIPRFGFSLLGMMGLIKKEDRLIKPIAIYFQ